MRCLPRMRACRLGCLEHRVMPFQPLHVGGVPTDHLHEEIKELVGVLRLREKRIQECPGGRGHKASQTNVAEPLGRPTEIDGRPDLSRPRLLEHREEHAATVAVLVFAVRLVKCVLAPRKRAVVLEAQQPRLSRSQLRESLREWDHRRGLPCHAPRSTPHQTVMRECQSVADRACNRIYLILITATQQIKPTWRPRSLEDGRG